MGKKIAILYLNTVIKLKQKLILTSCQEASYGQQYPFPALNRVSKKVLASNTVFQM